MSNQIRIIGGRWRGRKLRFPDATGLRPTPDRVRETVFNWLMHDIHDANCLDAFAGSGALGLEALSRGAKNVVFLEQNSRAAVCIRKNLKELDALAKVIETNTLNYLKRPANQQFNLIFLDPPFHKNLLPETLLLLRQGWLAQESLVYIESENSLELECIIRNTFEIIRDKKAGELRYSLARVIE